MSSDNYQEEVSLLLKQLKRPDFRFIVVRFNHYSVITRIKEDLATRFPDRPLVSFNCESANYGEIQDTFTRLDNGLVCLDNFELVLDHLEVYSRAVVESFREENARRHAITTQLNLRRDYLAKHKNAFILFVFARDERKLLKTMMERMPDMWSFRSLVLEIKVSLATSGDRTGGSGAGTGFRPEPITDASKGRRQRIEEMREELGLAAPGSALVLTIYPRLVEELKVSGFYGEAIHYALQWEEVVEDYQRSYVLVELGDLYVTVGELPVALEIFERAYASDVKYKNKHRQCLTTERIGRVLADMGNLSKAMEYYQRYREISTKLVEEAPENQDFKNNLALSYEKLGATHRSQGNLVKALHFFEQYNTLEKELHADYPDNAVFKNNLALSYEKLGRTYLSLGDFARALHFFEQYNTLEKELHAAYSDNVDFKKNLALSYEKLGFTYRLLGDFARALHFFEQYNTLVKELHAAYPDNVDFKHSLALSYEKLGVTYHSLSDFARALHFFEQYNTLEKELYMTYPDNVGFKNSLAVSYEKLGEIYESLGEKSQAATAFKKSTKLLLELVRKFSDNLEFKSNLGEAFRNEGGVMDNPDEKKRLYQKAETIWVDLTEKSVGNVYIQELLEDIQERLAKLNE